MKLPLFLERLKEEAEANPMMALGGLIVAATSVAKIGDTVASVRSKNAYAKQVKFTTKQAKKKSKAK